MGTVELLADKRGERHGSLLIARIAIQAACTLF
jgi:hypothetical protein